MMQVELVRTTTRDTMVLDGVYHRSLSPTSNSADIDAAVCLSGVGSNFYGSELIESIAVRLTEVGIAALRVNTRGHDGVSTAKTASGGVLQGAAYETVDDCRHDVATWIDFLRKLGHQRIALVGHSLGALKSLYSQAFEPCDGVEHVLAISPPCLSYDSFRRSSQATSFQGSLATAQQFVAEGSPSMLFRATFPFPLVISAATYIDKYGPGERYNFLKWATQIRCKVAFVFGGREIQSDNPAFSGIVEQIPALPWLGQPASVKIIADANHNYTGCLAELTDLVQSCVTSTTGSNVAR